MFLIAVSTKIAEITVYPVYVLLFIIRTVLLYILQSFYWKDL